MSFHLPVAVEVYETFRAPNPWAANAPGVFRVAGFRWGSGRKHDMAKTRHALSKGKRPRGIFAGLESQDWKARRMLPRVLQDLWWTRQLPARDVPWVLHEIEPSPPVDLKSIDEVQAKFVLGLVWLLCVTGVIGLLATGQSGALLHETFGVVCLSLAVGPPLLIVFLIRWAGAKERKVRERVLALLRERAASAPGAGGPR